jgi:hypothetical protein
MRSSDHASGVLSRKAKRLDSAPRHGTLAHARLKGSFVSPASLLSFPISIDRLLGLQEHLARNAWWEMASQAQVSAKARIEVMGLWSHLTF